MSMSHSENFRVIADLGNYFVDHRRRAYVLVKDDIKTVLDLQKRISYLFKLDNFDFCSNGNFLHPLEDIRVLSHNEIICLIPRNPDDGVRLSPPETAETDSNTKILEESETSEETSLAKKKKRKKLTTESLTFSSSSEGIPKKRKRCKSQDVEKKIKEQKEMIKETSTRKEKPKEKPSKINFERARNPKKLMDSDVQTVRLSRELKCYSEFSNCTPIPRSTDKYLAKKKINIVKIDLLKTCNQSLSQEDSTHKDTCKSTNVENNCVEPKIPVKKLIEDFEKFSPESQKPSTIYEATEIPEGEAVSAAQNAILDDTGFTTNWQSHESIKNHTEVLNNMEFSSNASAPQPSARSIKSAAKSISGVGCLLEQLRESDSVISLNSDSLEDCITKRKRLRKRKRKSIISEKLEDAQPKSTSIPHVLLPLNTRSCPKVHIKFEDSEENSLVSAKNDLPHSGQHVEDNIIISSANPSDTVNGIEQTSLSTACQSLNLKDKNTSSDDSKICKTAEYNIQLENGSTTEAENSLLFTQNGTHVDYTKNGLNSSTSDNTMGTPTVEDEVDDIIQQNIIDDESIAKACSMNLIDPKVGDIIAFKVLRMSEDYTPTVSSYIVGKVKIYEAETLKLHFKILRGEDQLASPSGKLTLNEDECDSKKLNLKEYSWLQLLEPRLIYP